MKVRNARTIVVCVLAIAVGVTLYSMVSRHICFAGPSGGSGDPQSGDDGLDYSLYERVLARHVNDRGLVNYRQLKNNRGELDQFTKGFGTLNPSTYQEWDQADQLAFWINAYNALTLKAVIDHYPIRAGFFKSLVYPKNSIRQIPGVWDELAFPVLGRTLTLNDIEHQIIRKEFREPRIHLALVCASRGCPPLRSEPYRGEELDAQLNDQAHAFLSDPEKFHIDKGQGRIDMSGIFDWFKQDFAEKYTTETGFLAGTDAERPVLKFISSYLPERDAQYLREGKYELEYLDYDWSLNEQ